jgi:hypothetical protein
MHGCVGRTKLLSTSFGVLGALLAFVPRAARADEPVKATEPTLMSEPGEVVEVVDAFDDKNKDPFDLHLSLGFTHSWETAKIRRESNLGPDGQESQAGFGHNIENIAKYSHKWSTLNMRADIGLFHDLGLYIRVPFIVADDRSLDDLEGSKAGVNAPYGRASDTANGAPFFQLPFKSPTRSGIDYIAVGLRWSIFNQMRDPTKPTWTIELEGRFGIGEPMHACNASENRESIPAGAYAAIKATPESGKKYPECPSPGNAKFDSASNTWYRDPRDGGRSAGISRGTNAVKLGTLVSTRYRYVEPYGGFWFMAEFQKRGTDMGDFNGVEGVITNHPPLYGGISGGLMIHPWENWENFQRFTVDLRFNATYVSQGRDYSPMFDALGSSNAPSLIAPNPSSYKPGATAGSSVGDYSKQIHFMGVTDVEAHGIFGGTVAFVLQAGRYIKFNFGLGMRYVQAHLVSTADACNPDLKPEVGEAGRCSRPRATGSSAEVTGTPNPNHRANIDLPGRRFRVTEDFIWDAWIAGTVMF